MDYGMNMVMEEGEMMLWLGYRLGRQVHCSRKLQEITEPAI